MKPGLAYYLAVSRPTEPMTRCCSDEPARVYALDRPLGPIRWTRKLRSAMPAVASVLRSSFSHPAGSSAPDVGSSVVTARGEHVGTVTDLMVGLRSGRSRYAVRIDEGEGHQVLVLLPRAAFRTGPNEDVFVVDARALERSRAA
jgi:sporulation protein YlmC with PRC-barrel domain